MTGEAIHTVAIVGAGPAGATCAWYLARGGIDVALLEKRAFPRDKICGDAICSIAQTHLTRMGVLRELLDNNEAHPAALGGMVSPGGVVALGRSVDHIASSPVIAVRRLHMDERIARAAVRAGATLIENCFVSAAEFDATAGVWTIKSREGATLRARMLIAADGATSSMARGLGLLTSGPDAVCSRAYIDARSSTFAYDGVAFYPRELLPGYCAVFRESRDELNFCLYIIPGGRVDTKDLRAVHERVLRDDPFVRKAVGPNARIGPVQGAPLRLGGIPRSTGDHLLVIGDAAGHIDPLTGEGIQYAMDAAEIAADTVGSGLAAGDLRQARLSEFERRCKAKFLHDFAWSARIAQFYGRYPSFLDAGALGLRKGGEPLLAEWAEIMTGARPKRDFLKPGLLMPVIGGIARRALRPLDPAVGLAAFEARAG